MINFYYCCVPNRINQGKQCKIVWYADDKNSFNVNPKVIDKLLSDLKVHCGDAVITREKKLSFLSMNIETTKYKKLI